jgi:hypothetical protein
VIDVGVIVCLASLYDAHKVCCAPRQRLQVPALVCYCPK